MIRQWEPCPTGDIDDDLPDVWCRFSRSAGFENTRFMSLSDLQQRVAALVFSFADADGFSLARGGALIAHDVVDRTTRDLDCFGPARDASAKERSILSSVAEPSDISPLAERSIRLMTMSSPEE